MSDALTEYGHEFRRVGAERRVCGLLTVPEFEALSGKDFVAVVLQRRRPGKRPDISGVLFLKARRITVADGALALREDVIRSLSLPSEDSMGYIVYDGPSRLDGKPIMVVVTPQTRNVKTGPMAQVWIMRRDVDPVTAAHTTGEDRSVCGNCIHRPNKMGTCYVNLWQAPARVFHAAIGDRYQRMLTPSERRRLSRQLGAIRLGAYGDPAAVPLHVWQELLAGTKDWTSYTHQWQGLVDPEWREMLMASVDSPKEADAARAAGWRTFRVRTEDQPVQPGEFVCPASEESQHTAAQHTCSTCLSCNGRRPGRENQAQPVIIVHGPRARKFDAAAIR